MPVAFVKRLYYARYPPETAKSTDTLVVKFGILGAAAIAPAAIINPAKSHPNVIIHAVAARDPKRAAGFAKRYNIPTAYGSYQELLDDPDINAVYNPLPNGLHYEWTIKALLAGKHVLLEKPSANTALETSQMFELARERGLVLLEAFHYRFHPAIQRVKTILDSSELGRTKHISIKLTVPSGVFKADDIRLNYDLGGGAMMDMGCYTLHCMRYLAGANPLSVVSATSVPHLPAPTDPVFKPNVDRCTMATLLFPNELLGELTCDLAAPPCLGFVPRFPQIFAKVECSLGTVEFTNFVLPGIYHTITVQKDGHKQGRTEKMYTFADAKVEGRGEDWWSTYRYQLEAFVNQVLGRSPQTWIDTADSVQNMEWIEKIYDETGLGSRPRSNYSPPADSLP